MPSTRALGQLLLALAFVFRSALVGAQSPTPRLTGEIRGDVRDVLPGSLTPLVRATGVEDLGPLPAGTPVNGITLALKRSPDQEADLQAVMAAQLNPASPEFHRWLTPEQFAARFGVADADLAHLRIWAERQGFKVRDVSRSRDRITFSGNAAEVASAFGTPLHRYRTPSGEHFAPASELSIPTVLTPLVGAVLHLNDFRPQPQMHVLHLDPLYTTASGQAHRLDALDVAVQYDVAALYKAGYQGSGQSIAIVGQSYVNAEDFSSFAVALGLGSLRQPTMVLVPNSGVEAYFYGDEAESDIDLEYSGALASAATLNFVFTGDNSNYNVFDSLRFAITSDIAPIISVSYDTCETNLSTSELTEITQITEQANVQGQTIVAAAGDSGSNGCLFDTSLTTTQRQALETIIPASLANVTGVGGLQMAAGTFTSGNTQYFAPASGADLDGSLLSYVPEVVWNEDAGTTNRAAGGGGTSTLVPRPAWQTGVPGISPGAFRLVPDIALQASAGSPGYVVCSSDPSTFAPGQVNSCYNFTLFNSLGNLQIAGGTSFSAPIFAGMLAVLNQATRNGAQGNINPVLYALAANPATYASAFHDITVGGNQCDLGPGSCSIASQTSYMATPGYDEASGLGSVDLAKLVSVWPSTPASLLTPTTVQVGLPTFSFDPGSTQQATVTVDVNNGYNTGPVSGTLQILVDGQVVQAALPFTYSLAQFPFTAPLTTGSHVLSVAYSGDATHGASLGSAAFSVGTLTATGSFALVSTSLSLPANGTTSGNLTVTPSSGYNGVVRFRFTTTSASPAALCYSIGQANTYNGTSAPVKFNLGAGTACSSGLKGALRMGKGPTASTTQPGAGPVAPGLKGEELPVAFSGAALLLCSLGWRRQKGRLPALLLSALLVSCCLGLASCSGGGGNQGGGPTPTPAPAAPQTVTIMVTGTDSVNATITSATTFTLTVGQ